jgi:hypothetical protein
MSTEYLAGFLDGEGSIGVYRSSHRRDRAGALRASRSTSRLAMLQASGYRREPLDMLVARFGGTLTRAYLPSRGRHVYHWRCYQQDAVARALTDLIPFLTVKRGEAEMALAFLGWRAGLAHTPDPWADAEAESFEEALKIVKRLDS